MCKHFVLLYIFILITNCYANTLGPRTCENMGECPPGEICKEYDGADMPQEFWSEMLYR